MPARFLRPDWLFKKTAILAAVDGSPIVAVHQGAPIGSRDLCGLGHFPGIGDDTVAPFAKSLHDARADSLRSACDDRCLAFTTHDETSWK